MLVIQPQDWGLPRAVNIHVVSPSGPASNVAATPFTETLAQLSAENPAVRTNWLEATSTPGTEVPVQVQQGSRISPPTVAIQ